MIQITYIKICLIIKFADFKSRASRSEYWSFVVFCLSAIGLFAAIDYIVFGSPIISSFLIIGLICPGTAVAVRRLHDLGRSGKFLFILLSPLSFLPIIFVVSEAMGILYLHDAPLLAILFWLSLAAGIIAPLGFMALPGELASNRFGENEAPAAIETSSGNQDVFESIKGIAGRYGLTSEGEDKKTVLTKFGYGAIGALALTFVFMFYIFTKKDSELTNFYHLKGPVPGYRTIVSNNSWAHHAKIIESNFSSTGRKIVLVSTYSEQNRNAADNCRGVNCPRSIEFESEINCSESTERLTRQRLFSGYRKTGSILRDSSNNSSYPGPWRRINLSDPLNSGIFNLACR